MMIIDRITSRVGGSHAFGFHFLFPDLSSLPSAALVLYWAAIMMPFMARRANIDKHQCHWQPYDNMNPDRRMNEVFKGNRKAGNDTTKQKDHQHCRPIALFGKRHVQTAD